MIYKFNNSAPIAFDSLRETTTYKLYNMLDKKIPLSLDEKRMIERACNQGSSVPKGLWPRLGWAFDFRRWMNRYWVKCAGGEIVEVYAFSKNNAIRLVASPKEAHMVEKANG